MLRALNKKVVIEKIDEGEQVTKTGIVLASEKNSPVLSGKVLDVAETDDKIVEVGSTVYFSSYDADTIEYDREEYLIVDIDRLYACER